MLQELRLGTFPRGGWPDDGDPNDRSPVRAHCLVPEPLPVAPDLVKGHHVRCVFRDGLHELAVGGVRAVILDEEVEEALDSRRSLHLPLNVRHTQRNDLVRLVARGTRPLDLRLEAYLHGLNRLGLHENKCPPHAFFAELLSLSNAVHSQNADGPPTGYLPHFPLRYPIEVTQSLLYKPEVARRDVPLHLRLLREVERLPLHLPLPLLPGRVEHWGGKVPRVFTHDPVHQSGLA